MEEKEYLINRLKDAEKVLSSGYSYKIGDMTIRLVDANTISAGGASNYYFISNLTKEQVLIELNNLKEYFWEVVNLSNDFLLFLQNKKFNFAVGTDYGDYGILLCEEKDGVITYLSDDVK